MATTYYVTQAGAGSANGTSLGNAWSVATFNGITSTNPGDTVLFSGAITSQVTPADSGSSNNPITLDFSAATFTAASTNLISVSDKSWLTILGGVVSGSGDISIVHFANNLSASHDIIIDGWTWNASSETNIGQLCHVNYCYNLTVRNNHMTLVRCLVLGDTSLNHDLLIRNNYHTTSRNTTDQTDIVFLGDCRNVTIEGNYFVMRTAGATSVRHNDILQTYQGGGGSSAAPYGWIIRYNYLILDVVSGSGDSSFSQLENMTDNGATKACLIYGNVFVGSATDTGSNNGLLCSGSGCTYYIYNNTFYHGAGPGNICVVNNGGGAATLYARNNAGSGSSNNDNGLSWTCAAGATWDYNRFFNWNSPSSTYTGSHGIANSDPLFTDPANGDFSTQTSSGLRNSADNSIGATFNQGIAAGATWPNPTLVNRTVTWDVGAFQFIASSGAPTLTSATINSAGTVITFVFNIAVAFGAGGNGGWTPSLSGGAASLTYSSGTGSTSLVYSISRGVSSGETGTVSYTQPGNGVESTADQTDLATLTNATVTNNSAQGSVMNVTTLNATTLRVG